MGGWSKWVGGQSVCVAQVCVSGQSVWPKCMYVCVCGLSMSRSKWMGGQVDGWSSGSVGGEVGWGQSVWPKCVYVCVA